MPSFEQVQENPQEALLSSLDGLRDGTKKDSSMEEIGSRAREAFAACATQEDVMSLAQAVEDRYAQGSPAEEGSLPYTLRAIAEERKAELGQ